MRIALIIVLFLAGYFSRLLFWFPFSIQAGACATFFMYVGYIGRMIENNVKELPIEAKRVSLVFAMVTWFCFMRDFQSFWLVHCDVGRGVVDIFGSICGCISVIFISKVISCKLKIISRVLAYVGRYSLLVLCTHIVELHFFPWEEMAARIIAMGMPESYKILYIIVGKLILDLGCACFISKIAWLRRMFGYKSDLK